ncbi:MAG: tetratricopeptide repeat protein [Candidatus Gastranaerophilales bacterium]|nr:tetratricopeptide repeat protein [Candidatus Gastranaerophilales bacterium]
MEDVLTLEDAIALIDEEKFKEAKCILTELLKTDDQNPEIWRYTGLCNVNLKKYQHAFLDFNRTVELNPEDAVAWFYLGSMADKLENYPLAETAYKKVMELRPDYADAYKSLIIMYLKTSQTEKIDEYEETIYGLSDDDYQIFYMLGTVYMATNRYDKAVQVLEKASSINPDHAMILNNLGSANLALRNLDKAMEAFEKALACDDKNAVTHYNIGVTARMMNDFEKAYKFYKSAYDLEPSPFHLANLASASIDAEDFEEAVNYYSILSSSEPDKEIYKYQLAVAYEGIKDYEKALEIFQSLDKSENTAFQVKMRIAGIRIKLKDFEAAKDIYMGLIKKGKVDENIYYDYAILCGQTGDKDKAEALLKKVIQLNKDFAPAHKDLAILYLDSRLFDYAKEELDIALSLEPDNPYILYEYGNFLQMTGNSEKANEIYDSVINSIVMPPEILLNIALNKINRKEIDAAQEILEKAVKQNHQDMDILYNLGKIYFMKNNFDAAKQVFEDAMFLEHNPEVENMLAQIYMREENYKDAIGLFADIDKKYPMNTANLMNLAKCALKLDKKEDAVGYLHRYTEIFPEDKEAIALLADLM